MSNAENLLNLVGGAEGAESILKGAPKFIREALDQDDTLFNLRTKMYVDRGIQSALIQLDEGGEDYFRTTMPYHASFYEECVNLSDLRKALAELEGA